MSFAGEGFEGIFYLEFKVVSQMHLVLFDDLPLFQSQ